MFSAFSVLLKNGDNSGQAEAGRPLTFLLPKQKWVKYHTSVWAHRVGLVHVVAVRLSFDQSNFYFFSSFFFLLIQIGGNSQVRVLEFRIAQEKSLQYRIGVVNGSLC